MRYIFVLLIIFLFMSCESDKKEVTKIIFLHHSTGKTIWLGNTNKYFSKLTGKSDVKQYFKEYNKKNSRNFLIEERYFPAKQPYGWRNYPFDYYNIWVKNAGDKPFMEEPTLEILTKDYKVIIFKHCFPGSKIMADTGEPDINSNIKSVENYKLQYNALKNKMHEFPDNKFIVWTPAVLTKSKLNEDEAKRTFEFYKWTKEEWDETGDNIFIWDFYKYETEGELYMLDKYAEDPDNSHPNKKFAARISPLFCEFVINVIEGSAR